MLDVPLSDLDELALTVRGQHSRTYIIEAIATYRARAYRSAIMATWVAVVFDIIDKIRELATQEEPAAKALAQQIDVWIDSATRGNEHGVKSFLQFERDVLAKAAEEFEFITPHERIELERLRDDRHNCAHPAFAGGDALFQPTAELVRSHIVHAITHLLRHPPVQGKSALVRLEQDVLQSSFPSSQEQVTQYLEDRYLNRIRQGLLKNIVAVLLKWLIKPPEPKFVGHEATLLHCLKALQTCRPQTYLDGVRHNFQRLAEFLPDEYLPRLILLCGSDPECWDLLSTSLQIRIRQFIEQYVPLTGDTYTIFSAMNLDALRSSLVQAFGRFGLSDQATVLARYPSADLCEEAVARFGDAHAYRDAEARFDSLIRPLFRVVTPGQIRLILNTALKNNQIRDASGMDKRLVDLLMATRWRSPRDAWLGFIAALDAANDYPMSYNGLRAVLERDDWHIPPM